MVANMVAEMVAHMVADMVTDMVADMVTDMVADMEVDKLADMVAINVGHTALAPEGRERRSQAGQRAQQSKPAHRLLVANILYHCLNQPLNM